MERVGFEEPELLLLLPPGPPELIPPELIPLPPGPPDEDPFIPPGPPPIVPFVPLGGGPYVVVRILLVDELARAKDEPVDPSEIYD